MLGGLLEAADGGPSLHVQTGLSSELLNQTEHYDDPLVTAVKELGQLYCVPTPTIDVARVPQLRSHVAADSTRTKDANFDARLVLCCHICSELAS